MTVIPGYTILHVLGQGGMALVYLAEQQSLGRQVALKVLSPSRDPTAGERFLREARIAANLHHPNIVPIYDFGVHEGQAYIAMQYLPAGSIAPMAGEKLEPRAALRLLRDVAAALDYAHGHGIVHRDVKPDNILRGTDGMAMLSDFGIARLIQGESQLTAEGTSVGTPHYMSPEQLRGEKVDGRSDLYSLGVVFWQLVTGELPYTGNDGWSIGTQHLGTDIPRLPTALAHLQGLVDSLMAKRADARPATGADVVRRIDTLLAVSGELAATSAAAISPAITPAMAPARQGARRAPWLLGSLAVLLALALGWLAWRESRPAVPVAEQAVAPASVVTEKPSIVVLPFEDLSEARDQSYFSDGMSDELLNRLAQVQGMRVVGRTSAQSFKGKAATIAEIGKALKVGSVLEGTIRKDGDRLRVTVQLSNAADGFQLWSQKFDRKLTDIFAVQDEIAGAVVDALKLELLAGTRHQPPFEVYDLLLRGRQALVRNDYQFALTTLRQAASLDPDYAEAHALLAMAEIFVAMREPDPGKAAVQKRLALAAAERAVKLDPSLGDAFGARSYLRSRDWDWSGALADVEASVRLGPHEGRNHLRHGTLLATLRRLPEARAALERAVEADPMLTPGWYWLGRVRTAQADYAGARVAYNRAEAIDAGFFDLDYVNAEIHLLEGKPALAKQYFTGKNEFGVLMADFDLGDRAGARRALDALERKDDPRDRYGIAVAYAWMGEKALAMDRLERLLPAKGPALPNAGFEPMLRRLHGEPRFEALLGKVGLPAAP